MISKIHFSSVVSPGNEPYWTSPLPRPNSEKLQNLHFKPKLSFLRKNRKNDNKGEFWKFFTKIAIIGMAIFRNIGKIIYRVNS